MKEAMNIAVYVLAASPVTKDLRLWPPVIASDTRHQAILFFPSLHFIYNRSDLTSVPPIGLYCAAHGTPADLNRPPRQPPSLLGTS
jgi:hypothetical protein